MIAMDVQLDDRSTRFLLDQARKFPNEVRRAFYYSCGIALRMMRGRMSGKNKHIARWEEFTRKYRAQEHKTVFGGALMENRKLLSMQPEGDRVRVGWIGSLEDIARLFQEGGSKPTTPSWRHHLYKNGFGHGEVPQVSVTPQRPVVAQVREEAAKHTAEWTLGAFEKVLQRRIKAWEVQYKRSPNTAKGARAASRAAEGSTAWWQAYARAQGRE